MPLTVGDLKRLLAGRPDDMAVWVDFQTDYDGYPTERSGPATDAVVAGGAVRIAADDGNARRE